MVSYTKQLLDGYKRKANNRIERLEDENLSLKIEKHRLEDRIDEGHCLALEFISDTAEEMRRLNIKANEVDKLQSESIRQKNKIQQLENKVREVKVLKHENTKLKTKIQRLKNEARKIGSLKDENAKQKTEIQQLKNEARVIEILRDENIKQKIEIQQLKNEARVIEILRDENIKQKTEIQQLKNEAKKIEALKNENIKQKTEIQQLKNEAREVETLKHKNTSLEKKIQQLEEKAKGIDDLRLENAELKTKIPKLENKTKYKTEAIKRENKKYKNSEQPENTINKQEAVNAIESSQSEVNIQKIKQIEKHVTTFINNFKLSIRQFKIDAEKRNRQRCYFRIRSLAGRYGENHSIRKKFQNYKSNYQKNRDDITKIVNLRHAVVKKIRTTTHKCTLQIDNALEDVNSQTEELSRLIEEDIKSVKKSISMEDELYEQIINIHSSIQNGSDDCVEKMDVYTDSGNRKR